MKQYENEQLDIKELGGAVPMDRSISGNDYVERGADGRVFRGNVFEFVKEINKVGEFEINGSDLVFDVDIKHGAGTYPIVFGYITQWITNEQEVDEGTLYPLSWSNTGGDISFSINNTTEDYINVTGYLQSGASGDPYSYLIKLRVYREI